MGIVKKKAQVIKKAEKIFTPTQNRIFSMDKEILLQHYILIMMKASSMSAEERRLVNNRVQFGVDKGSITEEDLMAANTKLKDFMFNKTV